MGVMHTGVRNETNKPFRRLNTILPDKRIHHVKAGGQMVVVERAAHFSVVKHGQKLRMLLKELLQLGVHHHKTALFPTSNNAYVIFSTNEHTKQGGIADILGLQFFPPNTPAPAASQFCCTFCAPVHTIIIFTLQQPRQVSNHG